MAKAKDAIDRSRYIGIQKDGYIHFINSENRKEEERLKFVALLDEAGEYLGYICREQGYIVCFFEYSEFEGELVYPDYTDDAGGYRGYNAFRLDAEGNYIVIKDFGHYLEQVVVNQNYKIGDGTFSFIENDGSRTTF